MFTFESKNDTVNHWTLIVLILLLLYSNNYGKLIFRNIYVCYLHKQKKVCNRLQLIQILQNLELDLCTLKSITGWLEEKCAVRNEV